MSFRPPANVAKVAERGLALRRKYGRGGTDVAIARARDLKNRRPLTLDTLKKMRAWYARHERNKAGGASDAGRIAWMLWGGDAGRAWVHRTLAREQARAKVTKARTAKRNPSLRQKAQREYTAAVELFRAFSGHEPRFVDEYAMKVPTVGMQVGLVTGIMYKAKRDGVTEEYLHEFTGKSRPILAVSPDGRQILILGGDYQFTDHGIEDR